MAELSKQSLLIYLAQRMESLTDQIDRIQLERNTLTSIIEWTEKFDDKPTIKTTPGGVSI